MSEITRNQAIQIVEDIRTAISAGSVTNTLEARVLEYCVVVLGRRIEETGQSGYIENLPDIVAFLAGFRSPTTLSSLLNAINGKIPAEASDSNKLADKAFVTGLTDALQNAVDTINGKIPAEASGSNNLADKAFVTVLTTALQNAVDTINANIGNGYVYAGIATPSGTPVSGKVFYLARQAGQYTNFGGLTVTEGINILKRNGSAWTQEQLISMADIYKNPLMGYYECDTAGDTAAKAVTAAGYVLPATGGSVKIKMANRNTVANATLNINSTGAKPLYYNGQRAEVGNTWDTNEIVEVFYDGTNYQAYNVAGSNGDGVFDISAYNLTNGQPTPYPDLETALGTDGEHVPESLHKGGMIVKFIQGNAQDSDNKYVQYFLTKNEWSASAGDWEKMNLEEEVSQLQTNIGCFELTFTDSSYQKTPFTIPQGSYLVIEGSEYSNIRFKTTINESTFPVHNQLRPISYDANYMTCLEPATIRVVIVGSITNQLDTNNADVNTSLNLLSYCKLKGGYYNFTNGWTSSGSHYMIPLDWSVKEIAFGVNDLSYAITYAWVKSFVQEYGQNTMVLADGESSRTGTLVSIDVANDKPVDANFLYIYNNNIATLAINGYAINSDVASMIKPTYFYGGKEIGSASYDGSFSASLFSTFQYLRKGTKVRLVVDGIGTAIVKCRFRINYDTYLDNNITQPVTDFILPSDALSLDVRIVKNSSYVIDETKHLSINVSVIGELTQIKEDLENRFDEDIQEINKKIYHQTPSFVSGSITVATGEPASSTKRVRMSLANKRCKLTVKSGYYILYCCEYSSSEIGTSSYIGYVSPKTTVYEYTGNNYVAFVVRKDEDVAITPQDDFLDSFIDYSNIEDELTGLEERVSNLEGSGLVGDIFELQNPQVKSYIDNVTYSDNDYTTTEVTDYATEQPYRTDYPLPVKIAFPSIGNAQECFLLVSTSSSVPFSSSIKIWPNGANQALVYNLIPGKTYYYKLYGIINGVLTAIKNSTFTTTGQVRMLKIEGLQNLRDIGGWSVGNNQKVKYDKIFRGVSFQETSQPNLAITDNGVIELRDNVDIGSELDLRGDRNRYLPENGGDSLVSRSGLGFCVDYTPIAYTQYTGAVSDTSGSIVTIFNSILTALSANKKVYIHCQGGCDRTGTLIFLLLGVLGVSESDLAKEYELSSFSVIGSGRRRNSTTYNYSGMVTAIKEYTGATLKDKMENFFIDKGVSSADIDAFRALMID